MNTQLLILPLAALFALTVPPTYAQQPDRQCVGSLDIIFAVDGSNSMGYNNFQIQVRSLTNLVDQLDVSDTEIHVGLVLFSIGINTVIDLSGDKADVIRRINALEYPDEETRTDLAIDQAVAMFNKDGRSGSTPRLLMVVTDGASTEPDLTLASATAAKGQGINIFTVGVGQEVDVEELNAVATSPKQVFFTTDFDTLEASLFNATNIACVNLDKNECDDAMIDIVFVLDSSSAVGSEGFDEMKLFVRDFLSFAAVDNGNIRVGLLTFADSANVQFQMSRYRRNKNGLLAAINNLQYRSGSSNMASAFQTLRNSMYTVANGDRVDVPNVVIFLTASSSNMNSAQTIMEAESTRAEGIQIYGIGIGLGNSAELDGIASKPLENNRFLVNSFFDLRPVIESVYEEFNKFCETPPPVPACFMGDTDIWLVVDVSATAERMSRFSQVNDFFQLKNGLTEMLGIIQDPSVANPGVRVGMVTYSTANRKNVDVSISNSVDAAASAVQALPGSITPGGAQLVMALQTITTPPQTSDYRSYITIIAPESSYTTDSTGLTSQLTRLKALGYTIVPIIVSDTGALNQMNLMNDASGSDYYYNIENYVDLEAATKNFTRDRLCDGYEEFVQPRETNVSAADGLCADSGHRENGMGLVAHPSDCDKYIQCYYNPDGELDLAVVRNCPMGLHWNQEFKNCSRPCEAMCPYDQCKEDCQPYKMEGSCAAYWDCTDGVSEPKCCDKMFAFIPGLGCQMDTNCTDSCGAQKWCGVCMKKPNWEESAGYDVMPEGSTMWHPRPCFYYDFDVVDCDCTAVRDTDCPATSTFDFSDPEVQDALANNDQPNIRTSAITTSGDGIVLGEKSTVAINVNKMDGNRPWTIQMRFRGEEDFSPYGETLLTSGMSCGDSNKLIVSADDKFIYAEIWSRDFRQASVKVPYQGIGVDEFKDLIISQGDGVLSLSVTGSGNQYIAQTNAPSGVCFSCGLDLGAGLNKLSFSGEIQKISLHSCIPELFY